MNGAMTKKFTKPSDLQRLVQRFKRRSPSFLVDIVDCALRIPHGMKLRYPYNLGSDYYQPFFIIGSGRSGNTLLRKLLMERARVAIPPEIPGLGGTIRKFTQCGGLGWPECVAMTLDKFVDLANIDIDTKDGSGNQMTYNLLEDLDLDFTTIREKLLELKEEERALSVIISIIYETYSRAKFEEVLPWGDKTPWNVFHYKRIKKVFPRSRYIHMLRDGRDCVTSYIESLGERINLSATSAAFRWRDSVRACQLIERENQDRYLEIRYEQLVNDPDFIVSKAINFLGLEAISPVELDIDNLGDGKAIHHKKLNSPVDNKSIGRWKSALSKRETKTVNQIIARDLKYYGYAIE